MCLTLMAFMVSRGDVAQQDPEESLVPKAMW